MAFKPTPGPWTAEGYADSDNVRAADGAMICSRIEPDDARLIAAAPAMHAAIVEFCRRVDAGEVCSKKTYATFADILENLT